ncbi:hypothetical protein BKA69DRAFT_1067884 [Paraphysoderma sedebokerense]|nr:hypothetical protein BKA69DRAFT_1067884 [Paraphysoderma sedebokerense]
MILSSPTLPAKPFSPQTSPTTSPTSILSEAAFGEIDEYHAMKRINTIVETLQKILSLSAANNEMTTRWNMQRAMEMFRSNESDTGSPEVQIALLTVRINNLESHLKTHTRDIHSRRGLTQMKSKRDKLLKYLKRESLERYYHCVKRLGL